MSKRSKLEIVQAAAAILDCSVEEVSHRATGKLCSELDPKRISRKVLKYARGVEDAETPANAQPKVTRQVFRRAPRNLPYMGSVGAGAY